MEPERVADVWASGSYGSGYLLASRLIITALHVVAEGVSALADRPDSPAGRYTVRPIGGIRARLQDGAGWRDCRLVWPAPDAVFDDVALLEIVDGDVESSAVGARWGRPTTSLAKLDCELAGYPAMQRMPDGLREVEHATATLNPTTGMKTGHFQVLIDHPPNVWSLDADPSAAWAGMSGAAVLSHGLVIGLVIEALPQVGAGRLLALPVDRFFHDEGFQARLRDALGSEPLMESAELVPLLSAHAPAPILGNDAHGEVSFASLLRADVEAVRFRGRRSELRRLTQWCDGDGIAVALLTGPGGQGKTRLARRLAARLREKGWVSGFAGTELHTEGLAETLARQTVPTLVVIDYAETRPSQVRQLVEAAAKHGGRTALRLLLIARSAGDWWEELALQPSHLVRTILRAARVEPLLPLEDEPEGRADAFAEAVEDLSARISRLRPGRAVARPEIWPPGYLTQERYGSPLTLQMEALASLLEPDRSAGGRNAADVILDHEEPYWTQAAISRGLELPLLTRRRVVAAASLCGAETQDQAVDLLGRVTGIGHKDLDTKLRAALWVRDLYPPDSQDTTTDSAYWGSLQPDSLAEYLISVMFHKEPDSLQRWLSDAAPTQTRQALSVLARAALYDEVLPRRITALLVALPKLAVPAIRTAPRSENPGALARALETLVASTARTEANLPFFAELSNAMPRQTRLFSQVAVTIAETLVTVRRALVEVDRDAYLSDLAQSLNTLANRLGEAGVPEKALAAAEEAVWIRRELLRTGPGLSPDAEDAALVASLKQGLAESLETLANRMAAFGDHANALAAAEEATAEYTDLVADEPDIYRADLAQSLNTLAVRLAEVGQREDALLRAEQAVEIQTQLAFSALDRHRPDLARSLNTLANRLAAVGRRVEALRAAEQAVYHFNLLADDDPDAYLPDFSKALNNLALARSDMGYLEAALEPARDAVAIRRRLAEQNPAAYTSALASSLVTLADALGNANWARWYKGTLLLSAEAVEHYRKLAERNPASYTPMLARALTSRALWLAGSGEFQEALRLVGQAKQHYETLTEAEPDLHRSSYAWACAVSGYLLVEDGRPQEAVAPLTKALELGKPGQAFTLDLIDWAHASLNRAHALNPDAVQDEYRTLTTQEFKRHDLQGLQGLQARAISKDTAGKPLLGPSGNPLQE